MKRLIIIVAVCILLLAGGGTYWLLRSKYNVVITQQQIDEALAKQFPISKKHLYLFEVTYSNPRAILLPESDRVQIGLDAELAIKLPSDSLKFHGSTTITSSIGYRDDKKQFYLTNAEINNLTLPGVPQNYMDKATQAATELARLCFKEIPVYTFRGTDSKMMAAKLLLRKVEVKKSEIRITLGL